MKTSELKRPLIHGSSMLKMKQLEFKILISEESLLRNLTSNLRRVNSLNKSQS
jgi:hypothetical protein